MKKLFATLLSLLLITGCFSVCAQQPDNKIINSKLIQTVRYYGSGSNNLQTNTKLGSDNVSNEVKEAVFNDIYTALKNVEDSVDLSKYNIPYDIENDYSVVFDIINEVLDCSPDIYRIEGYSYHRFQMGNENFVFDLIFNFPEHTAENQTAKLAFCNSEINKIIAGIPQGSNDVQKVVYVHDYLVLNYEYDIVDYEYEDIAPGETIFDAYNFFKYKRGVCQAYTYAFKMIMDKLGIECYVATSVEGKHIWNTVKIKDKYYYVDCTGDDPEMIGGYTYDNQPIVLAAGMYGLVKHDHLLISAEQLEKLDRENESILHSNPQNLPSYLNYECNDKTFDSSPLKSFLSPVIPYNGNWYGVTCDMPRKVGTFNSNFTSFTQDEDADIPSEPYREAIFNEKGEVIGMGDLITEYDTVCAVIGSDIYINDPFTIFKYSLEDKTCKTVLRTATEEDYIGADQISGCYVAQNGKVGIILHNVFYEIFENPFPDYDNTVNERYYDGVRIGDFKNDGKIMADDLSIMKNYLLTGQSDVENFLGLADLTRNNTVDLLDFIKMKRMIAEQV